MPTKVKIVNKQLLKDRSFIKVETQEQIDVLWETYNLDHKSFAAIGKYIIINVVKSTYNWTWTGSKQHCLDKGYTEVTFNQLQYPLWEL